MDLALAVFNIGAGLGVLAAGAALVYLAWQTTPLIRESRALALDLRRLARTTDHFYTRNPRDNYEMAALATDLKLSIHPHPTTSETLMEAAEVFFGQSTHVYKPKKKTTS